MDLADGLVSLFGLCLYCGENLRILSQMWVQITEKLVSKPRHLLNTTIWEGWRSAHTVHTSVIPYNVHQFGICAIYGVRWNLNLSDSRQVLKCQFLLYITMDLGEIG
jgi:hypothetical protein